jgi:hypothetical protein
VRRLESRSANVGCQIGTQETAIGRFVCKTSYCAKTEVDCTRCQLPGFEMRAIAHNDCPIESQARFGTIPVHELIDGVTITPSPGWSGCSKLLFLRAQIGRAQNGFCGSAFVSCVRLPLHDRWPSCQRSIIEVVAQR